MKYNLDGLAIAVLFEADQDQPEFKGSDKATRRLPFSRTSPASRMRDYEVHRAERAAAFHGLRQERQRQAALHLKDQHFPIPLRDNVYPSHLAPNTVSLFLKVFSQRRVKVGLFLK